MIHYTINPGNSVEQNLSALSPGALDVLRPLVDSGGGKLQPPFAAYRVQIVQGEGCAVFTLFRGQEPLLTCGLASTQAGANEVWPAIEELYLGVSDKITFQGMDSEPCQPASIPWLAVLMMPHILFTAKDDVGRFGDFQLCMAAVILERATV